MVWFVLTCLPVTSLGDNTEKKLRRSYTATESQNHGISELEGTHEDHGVQLLDLHRTSPWNPSVPRQRFTVWSPKMTRLRLPSPSQFQELSHSRAEDASWAQSQCVGLWLLPAAPVLLLLTCTGVSTGVIWGTTAICFFL